MPEGAGVLTPVEPAAGSGCICPVRDARECAFIRSGLSLSAFEREDIDDQTCECGCHDDAEGDLDDDDEDFDEDDDEDEVLDCGLDSDGECAYAGSEECDECPYRNDEDDD